MKPKKNTFPDWFTPGHKPQPFWQSPPTENITELTINNELSKTLYGDGVAYETDDLQVDLDVYRYGSDDVDITVRVYNKKTLPNKDYNKQLKAFNKAKAEHEEKMVQWAEYKKLWDEQQKNKKNDPDYKLYLKLQKKFTR